MTVSDLDLALGRAAVRFGTFCTALVLGIAPVPVSAEHVGAARGFPLRPPYTMREWMGIDRGRGSGSAGAEKSSGGGRWTVDAQHLHGDAGVGKRPGYRRGKTQDESMLYEQRKHEGTLPVIGVNTFRDPRGDEAAGAIALARATEEEKQSQLDRVRVFQQRHREEAHAALTVLKDTARAGGNVFADLMDAARVCSPMPAA